MNTEKVNLVKAISDDLEATTIYIEQKERSLRLTFLTLKQHLETFFGMTIVDDDDILKFMYDIKDEFFIQLAGLYLNDREIMRTTKENARQTKLRLAILAGKINSGTFITEVGS